MRIGIVGGTFDPIHRGHLAMAELARSCAALERVLLIPSATPPHRGKAMVPVIERLRMCQLAIKRHPGLEVSELELHRDGPSYTVDTLTQLQGEFPGGELHLVLGWDAARELHSWHCWREVLRRAKLVIVPRPGYPLPTEEDLNQLGIPEDRYHICPPGTPDIDASKIRSLLQNGLLKQVAEMLDPEVAKYIYQNHLYRNRV